MQSMSPTSKPIFTTRESALLRAAGKATGAKELRALRKRLRTQRDTFRDRAERQQRESRGKQAPRASQPSATNANTTAKAAAFAEALAAVDAKLETAAAPGRDAGKAESSPSGSAAARPTRSRSASRVDDDPAHQPGKRRRALPPVAAGRAAGAGQSPSVAHTRAKHGAIQAHGKRNQARRDAR